MTHTPSAACQTEMHMQSHSQTDKHTEATKSNDPDYFMLENILLFLKCIMATKAIYLTPFS